MCKAAHNSSLCDEVNIAELVGFLRHEGEETNLTKKTRNRVEKAASALWNIARHGDESRRDEVVATEHALDSLLSAMQLGCYRNGRRERAAPPSGGGRRR